MSEDEVHSAAGVILNEGMRLEALSFKLLELITLDKMISGLKKQEYLRL